MMIIMCLLTGLMGVLLGGFIVYMYYRNKDDSSSAEGGSLSDRHKSPRDDGNHTEVRN